MTSENVPAETVKVFGRSIHNEAIKYGFSQVDILRLINELMDLSTESQEPSSTTNLPDALIDTFEVAEFPLRSARLCIRPADSDKDLGMLNEWMRDDYGRHFLLSSTSAETDDLETLLRSRRNQFGIILADDAPIGSVAFLEIDRIQRRAELRKLIGDRQARGKGFAEEATRLWIEYGFAQLGLEKIFVSTLQTHIRNIQLNETIGFRVEGLLQNEVRIGEQRYDVLRMGLTKQCIE